MEDTNPQVDESHLVTSDQVEDEFIEQSLL